MQQSEQSLPEKHHHIRVHPFQTLGEQKQSATYRLEFSPDGTILASIGYETSFWYEGDGAFWGLHHTSPGRLMRMNPDRTFLLLFARDAGYERIELQDSTGACLKTISANQLKQQLICGYSPDQRWLLTYNNEGWLSFWDAETLRFETRQSLLPAHIRAARLDLFRFTPDGKQLFFRNGGVVCRCQFSSDPPAVVPEGDLFGYPPGHFEPEDMKISPQGNVVAVASRDPYLVNLGVHLYENTSLQHMTLLSVADPLLLDFSPDGNYLACADWESNIHIWNITTGQIEQTFVSHPGPMMEQTLAVASMVWSPRGDILAVEGSLEEIHDYSIKLWKVEYRGSVRTQTISW